MPETLQPIDVRVILGPTASGKTALAMALCDHVEGIEVVSADSRQIYIGMDIGTAKPSLQERGSIPHHLIDLVTPDTLFSAGEFAMRARAAINDIHRRGKIPLVVGGSGFYVRALFEGLGAPKADVGIVRYFQERGEREGFQALYDELQQLDPRAAAAHEPENLVKTIRALCCYRQTGRIYSSFLEERQASEDSLHPHYLEIVPERALLYQRINSRVLAMFDAGLVEEVRRLVDDGYDAESPGMKTVGYAEALRFLKGDLEYDEMVSQIQQSTRRYAKRQMTWLRGIEGGTIVSEPDVGAGLIWLRQLNG